MQYTDRYEDVMLLRAPTDNIKFNNTIHVHLNVQCHVMSCIVLLTNIIQCPIKALTDYRQGLWGQLTFELQNLLCTKKASS